MADGDDEGDEFGLLKLAEDAIVAEAEQRDSDGMSEMFPASVPVFEPSHDPSTSLGMTLAAKL